MYRLGAFSSHTRETVCGQTRFDRYKNLGKDDINNQLKILTNYEKNAINFFSILNSPCDVSAYY